MLQIAPVRYYNVMLNLEPLLFFFFSFLVLQFYLENLLLFQNITNSL